MPGKPKKHAMSEAQRRAAGAAYRKVTTGKGQLYGAAKSMSKSMNSSQLKELAKKTKKMKK